MNASNVSIRHRIAVTILGAAIALAVAPFMSATFSDTVALQPLAGKDSNPLLTATFEKVTAGENKGGYVMHVKNDYDHAVTVIAMIVPSVTFHANAKTRTLPEKTIEAGKIWTVADLAAGDKITLTPGPHERTVWAPLIFTVP